MASTIWDKFFWGDWENDPALKLCSLAAQGLWMRMLCICATADPKGFLLVAGQPLSPADLAALVGKPVAEVEALLSELSSKGVFSRDRKGRIYSRRIVRDVNKSQIARHNGRKGGNPSLRKQTTIQASVNPQDKPPDKPHKPYAISQKGKQSDDCLSESGSDKATKPRKRRSYPEPFERFWQGYPTDALMSKKAAFEVWQRLDDDARQEAMASLPAFRAYCAGKPDYRPVHANRYLSQERFDGFNRLAETASSKVFVPKGSPEWEAWSRVRKVTPVMSEQHRQEGWWFESRWPPLPADRITPARCQP